MKQAFPPLVGPAPRLLLLGTFPSPLSREKGEYYGNPQNQFWRIVFSVFGAPFDNPSYDEKKRCCSATASRCGTSSPPVR